ncbi:(2,3-dihydroxybenzoyl)adenylate synthase [Vibrio coralliilyticus]|uniref:(2,3-dihydroxybenzoyl)adenylate synthase n=1 Tax=Vibrio coralliilyticus TaxID=190893 RepID=UPI00148DD9A1|nr:AMP-binding protein [Vibrio coralliilyticus]NOI27401.1 (2,3-dihydroxybenzoyl)adenylate synthase [Vibrio coralliilyticus]NOI46308.1 (2,3-dihydroxybenzoyl)adenylate synthase [Vibrio coralliilyticus]
MTLLKEMEPVIPHRYEKKQEYEQAGLWEQVPLWQLLWSHCADTRNQVAVRDDSRSLTYEELISEADQIAQGLISQGWAVGDRIVMQLTNSCEFAVTLFGFLRAGLIPVMALPAHGLAEIEHFMRVSNAQGYVGEGQIGEQIIANLNKQMALKLYLVNQFSPTCALPRSAATNFVPAKIDPAETALFLVSGGTTGLPKLIPRTHNDYLYNIRCCCSASEVTEKEIYLAVLPAAHNFTLGCPGFLGTLSVGGEVIFTQLASPDHCFELIQQYGVTATALVPALAQLWTEATQWEEADLTSLRRIQVGGSKLAYSDAIAMQKVFPGVLQQVFGMAEGLIACTRLSDTPEVVASMQGKPVSQWDEVRVVDADGKDVEQGEEGELLTRGPYTLRGYYRAPEHNARSFTADGFYCSGDKVRMNDQQYLSVTGRIKDVVNRAGECIAADEIEEQLLAHPQIAQVAVVAVPDPYLGERIGVAAVGRDASLTLQDLRQFLLQQNLATFKMPDELLLVPTLPKTAVGKIDKKAILGPSGTPWHLG